MDPTLLANQDSFNILTIGDSFTFAQGNQFDDSFPARLGRWLNLNHEQPKVEVYNWGVKGYSTVQELELLKRGLKIVHPKLVILEITLNDPEMEPYRATHRWLDKHGRVKLTSPIFSVWKSFGFVVGRLLNYQTRREYVDYYFHLFQDHESWSRFESALRSIKAITLENNVKLLVAVLPLFSHELNNKYPFKAIHEKVDTLLSQLQLPYVDLLKDFENIPPLRLQIDPGIDSHPNEIAQRIIAEGIYSKLSGSDLVPETIIAKNSRRIR